MRAQAIAGFTGGAAAYLYFLLLALILATPTGAASEEEAQLPRAFARRVSASFICEDAAGITDVKSQTCASAEY